MKCVCMLALLFLCFSANPVRAQLTKDSLPIRGFAIAAPLPQELDTFLMFVDKELAPRRINTLILRVDYNYQFTSHPELRDANALSKDQVKKIVNICRKNGIEVIPQINLLGHQSWASTTMNLLKVYPEFDETPQVKMPETYKWPNADSLYCKSYCPQHPKVHDVVFALVDEICDVFEAKHFHAGMDEVFYIGHDQCPRCRGKNKAELFAGEVKKIRDHLAGKQRFLWIWGDRLLDGTTSGMGMWEASTNGTWPAVDLIPKDVIICDWHYERADKTAVYFALKGLNVVTCPWRNPALAKQQMADMLQFRETATKEMKPRYMGIIQTVWSGAGPFLRGYYKNDPDDKGGDKTPWHCFKAIFNN